MGDGKVRVMDLACRGGALEDRITAVCKLPSDRMLPISSRMTVAYSQHQGQRSPDMLRLFPLAGSLVLGMG